MVSNRLKLETKRKLHIKAETQCEDSSGAGRVAGTHWVIQMETDATLTTKVEVKILWSTVAKPLESHHCIQKTPGPGFPSLSVLSASCLGFPWDSDCHTAPCDSPHHPLLFWVQVWYHFTPYILQKQMGSRGNSEGGRSLSKCRHSRFRSSVLFQPMVPWWVVNLSWQNWSNKTKQLYGTFKLKGLLILGEAGFLNKRQKQSQWNQVVVFLKDKKNWQSFIQAHQEDKREGPNEQQHPQKNPKEVK